MKGMTFLTKSVIIVRRRGRIQMVCKEFKGLSEDEKLKGWWKK